MLIVSTPDLEARIRTVFQETVLGPVAGSYDCRNDFHISMPSDAHPRFWEEGCALDAPRKDLTIDKLLSFVHFSDETGVARLSDRVTVTVSERPCEESNGIVAFDVEQDGEVVATVTSQLRPPNEDIDIDALVTSGKISFEPFVAPAFGVTMLGVSDGFDKDGSTTGFVIWMRRRGIMVDPPPDASEMLDRMGIPAPVVEGVILTHCHADHDAGTFQKILQAGRVTVMTTKTVIEMFLRKYTKMSGLKKGFLRRLFEFREAPVQHYICWQGAQLRFFYSLHAVPCVVRILALIRYSFFCQTFSEHSSDFCVSTLLLLCRGSR